MKPDLRVVNFIFKHAKGQDIPEKMLSFSLLWNECVDSKA